MKILQQSHLDTDEAITLVPLKSRKILIMLDLDRLNQGNLTCVTCLEQRSSFRKFHRSNGVPSFKILLLLRQGLLPKTTILSLGEDLDLNIFSISIEQITKGKAIS